MSTASDKISSLTQNIEELEQTITNLAAPTIDLGALVRENLMPTRRCVKLMLMNQCNGMSEEAAHIIVYGHNRIDDETVEGNYAMTIDSEMCRKVDKMKDDLINSVTSLSNELGKALMEQINLTAAAASAISAAADQLSTLPPQPLAAAHTYLTFNQLVIQVGNSFAKLIPCLGPIAYIPFVIADSAINSVITPINTAVTTLNTTLKAISAIKVP